MEGAIVRVSKNGILLREVKEPSNLDKDWEITSTGD